MPHAKEHPLAGRRVVPDAMTGASIYIVDWLDRLPGADSDGSRPLIPRRSRPAFRFDVGHHSEMKPATR